MIVRLLAWVSVLGAAICTFASAMAGHVPLWITLVMGFGWTVSAIHVVMWTEWMR